MDLKFGHIKAALDEIEFEEKCTYNSEDYDKCDYGYLSIFSDETKQYEGVMCPKCNGKGVVPTAFAEKLLVFIKEAVKNGV